MSLIPFRDRSGAATLRTELDNLFNRFPFFEGESRLPAAFTRAAVPAINIAESEKNWSVQVELPGLDEKDIQVQIMGQQLVISGERKWDEEKKHKEFTSVESQYGMFERRVELPLNLRLDADSVRATYKRGMLEITLPKVEPTPAAKIPVKAG